VLAPAASKLLTQYCTDCHGKDLAEARINLEQMTAEVDFGRAFRDWEKVIRMLRQGKMPPKDAPQPTTAERTAAAAAVESGLTAYIAKNAGDPGPVVLRRLTSAEYGYTIQDLTGLDLALQQHLIGDAAGGEGFTNVGGAQFLQDSTLERYLEAAKLVADHAVIGAGPLVFYSDPGQTGRELSAISRIKRIYEQHGFRTAAGEGAIPFGLDLYPRAMFVAWQYRNRAALGVADTTIAELAAKEGLSVRFCEHVHTVLAAPARSFPLAAIVQQWQSLSPPDRATAAEIRTACERVTREMREWQSMLAATSGDEEEAAVLTAGDVQVRPRHSFTTNINWEPGAREAKFEFSISSATGRPVKGALVIWRNARLRIRRGDNRRGLPTPLGPNLSSETRDLIKLGQHPAGGSLEANDFVTGGETTTPLVLVVPAGTLAARLDVEVELDFAHGADAIVRCSINDTATAGKTAAAVGSASVLLGNPASPQTREWQLGVAEFARLLPEVSHREAAPSDRDPIPLPFDNTYNLPERNHFHYAIKYHRDDGFLYEHLLDDASRKQLDQAWTDLLTSFEYHDASLRFIAKKYKLDLQGKGIAELDQPAIDKLPDQARGFVQKWKTEYAAMQAACHVAEPGHVEDVLQLAERAWRRPLAAGEQQRLRDFYTTLRTTGGLDHTKALRALLARVFVSPAFLYRAEPVAASAEPTPLSDFELASRLSYFLWSSLPDDELRRAAAAGELRDPARLTQQAQRMLKDPKARRLATEFFGQWLGFYQFDEFRGIDTRKFPEFNDALKSAMYGEAVGFFEHIIREDRPPVEILTADYAFLNELLARHYGIDASEVPAGQHVRVGNLSGQHRGGLLSLGAVLSVTSAPLRTSAVKRGDWVLRRVIGTPVPPPPADVGSIPAEESKAGELSVRERLERHRTDASCINCHSRIDPLGFALEQFDSLGRWRDAYQGGQPIDTAGVLSDGTKIADLAGLRSYLQSQQPQFERNLSGKLLAYALGRTELASDQPLIDSMLADLKDDGRFSALVVRIVTSKQFRYRRQ